ncbi:prephenate dehydrogenase (NADP(+)) [Gonapodya sp. JEL0774]|nr:prephenate dehydrogenase (NADP(+)) [Gonapodya sp. JEL0774]
MHSVVVVRYPYSLSPSYTHTISTSETLLKGSGLIVHRDGFGVARLSDLVFYSVEAKSIDKVVGQFGPVKEPEVTAFERYLPDDVDIVPTHSLHGPNVPTLHQPLVIIRHRVRDERNYQLVKTVLSCLESDFVELSYREHDLITADTQAATHLAFLSMGIAWKTMGTYPWESASYVGGIENVKVLLTMRIFSAKWHVYAGLAMMNPAAKVQVGQFARSASELFKLMITGQDEEFRKRILNAGANLFPPSSDTQPILLSDSFLDEFSLSIIPQKKRAPNSHLSLLAMADCWHRLNINPYRHLICQTPIFRFLLGITEYLFRNPQMLEDAITYALTDPHIRADDFEFCSAARGWVEVVESQNMEAYQSRWEGATAFFGDRLQDANKISGQLIAKLAKVPPVLSTPQQ